LADNLTRGIPNKKQEGWPPSRFVFSLQTILLIETELMAT